MDQEEKPRERSFIEELVPRWRPTRDQVLWAIRITVGVILILTVVALLGVVLWVLLDIYINPRTATERKDLVQSFAIVVAGAVGSLSALAAVGNLYVSRRNLQQARELERERAQEDTLPAYLDQMVQLLNDEQTPLRQAKGGDEVSILARVRTVTVLPRLDGNRKASVLRFLYEAGLINKDIPLVDLIDADLRRAYLHGARLSGAGLQGADLEGADLEGANLYRANLNRANLNRANLRDARPRGALLARARLSGADLSWADLEGADLSEAVLRGANLRNAKLSEAVLRGANLRNANLSVADLLGADLSDATLREADLRWTLLRETNLSGADLFGAVLSGAVLGDANLSDANLSYTRLNGTVLSGAVLSGAVLTMARECTEDQLRKARTLEGATMPNGQKYEDWLKDREQSKEDADSD